MPFYFYDEFMKAHDFYARIETMLAGEDFQTDFKVQDDRLDDLRDDIKDAETPQWIIDALAAMHGTYPEGQSLRYRSSTNNEDLPGFNGAGLYGSNTQHPQELSTERSRPAPTPFHSDILPLRPALYFYDTEGQPMAAESVVDITGDLEVMEDGGLTGPDGNGAAGSAHDLDPRSRGAGERIGAGGRGRAHRRRPAL